MNINIYRVTAQGETDAALGYDTINGAMWFARRRDAENFVRGCVQAWHDNPPGFFDETEAKEYHAQDFRSDYDIERMSLSDAIEDMDDPDDIRAVIESVTA